MAELLKLRDQQAIDYFQTSNQKVFMYWSIDSNAVKTLIPENNQVSSIASGGSQVALQVQEDGSNLGSAGDVGTINFTGTNVTASRSGNTVTVAIAGGGITDGDKGDITVSGGGTSWNIDSGAITDTKIATGVSQSKITGLVAALASKLDSNTAITAGTNLKISYDSDGLVTAGTTASLDDLSDVIITAPTSGQGISYNGTNWVNEVISSLYKGKMTSVASIKALAKASLIDSELRIVNNVPYMWNVSATNGAFQPTDTASPGIDAGWWIKVADEYAGVYSSSEAYSVGDLVIHNNQLYKANASREDGVWASAPITSDSQFRPVGGIIEDFNDQLSYPVGALVYDDSFSIGPFKGVYSVVNAFTGGSFPSPSGFSLLLSNDQFKGTFTSLAYAIGDIVEYQGQLYKATAANGTNGLLGPFPTASWTLISSTTDVIVAYQDYSLFKADTTTIFKVGDKITIDNPFQVLQVLTAGTGFAGITTQFIVNQAQGLEFSNGVQFAADFTPDQVLFGNNYYVAFLTGTTNINVAALQNDGIAGIASVGQVVNFTVFNTTLVSSTIVFDASWKDSSGAALGTITLAAGEYRRITFEGYYAIPTQLRLVETNAISNSGIENWLTGTSYAINNLVYTETRVYRCTVAHTGSALFNTDRANWEVIVPLKTGLPWAASTYYYNGDIVEYAPEGIFIKKSVNGFSSAIYDNSERTAWTLVSSTITDPYTGGIYYHEGQQVTFANKTLRQVIGQVSNATFDVLESGKWAVLESRTDQWTANTLYYANEQVTNNGLTYSRASTGLSGTSFDSTEELNWLRVGEYSNNIKTVIAVNYTILPNDSIIVLDATSNDIVLDFPLTLPEGKEFLFQYVKTSNDITFGAGAGTTIVDPTTYLPAASFNAPGTVGQYGTIKIFRIGTIFNFLG
jgi:hypothetical protein